MQDLNVINKLNNEAVERDIPRQLAAGKIVVAEYSGLHFIGYETFSGDDAEANAKAKVAEFSARRDSSSGRIFYPTPVTA
jgi:hypothetical protein